MSVSAATFARNLNLAVQGIKAREEELFRNINTHVARSLRFGSPTTGAPGQPVDTMELLNSYTRTGSIASRLVTHAFRAPHALTIEHNLRGAMLHSAVGGFHSIKLTRLGFNAIIRWELAILKARATVFTGGATRGAGTGRFAKAF